MAVIDETQFLAQLNIFKDLDDWALDALSTRVQVTEYALGHPIVFERDVADTLYMVQRGRIATFTIDKGRLDMGETIYTPDTYFNDAWLLEPSFHQVGLAAETAVTLLTISRKAFQSFLKENEIALEHLNLSSEARLHMPLSLGEKIAFLENQPLFEQINEIPNSDVILKDLANITKQYAFLKGSVLIHQKDVADNFLMIQSGRIEAFSVNRNGVTRRIQQYLSTDRNDIHTADQNDSPRPISLNDSWVLSPKTFPFSLRARQNGRILSIENKPFLKFLNKHPRVRERLQWSDEAQEEMDKITIGKSNQRYRLIKPVPEELIELETRRSRWILVFNTFKWFLIAIVLFILIYIILLATVGGRTLQFNSTWLLFALSPALLLAPIIIFQYLDWANDYLIITNKRLIHTEYELTKFSGSKIETNLDQVQSVEIQRPTLLHNMLGLGTIHITTSAQSGVLTFDFLKDPQRIEKTLDRIREQKKSIDKSRFAATMRNSFENYFNVPSPLTEIKEPKRSPPPPTGLSNVRKSLQKFFNSFKYRTQEGNVVTYHKHIIVLLIHLPWPALTAVIILLIHLATGYFEFEIGFRLLLTGILSFAELGWLMWLYEDWRNDTFQITDRYVIDIDRLPFGFRESRKKAQLDDIQNVQADMPNIWATIFKYGFVKIETAGAKTDIVFENVAKPSQVQNEIFKRRSAYQSKQRKNKQENQRKEYAVLLDIFMQERELNRVGRRTPDFDIPEF